MDHLLIAGRRHLEYVLSEFTEHYQEARPHQGLGQRTPRGEPAVAPVPAGRILRSDRLGGRDPRIRPSGQRDPTLVS